MNPEKQYEIYFNVLKSSNCKKLFEQRFLDVLLDINNQLSEEYENILTSSPNYSPRKSSNYAMAFLNALRNVEEKLTNEEDFYDYGIFDTYYLIHNWTNQNRERLFNIFSDNNQKDFSKHYLEIITNSFNEIRAKNLSSLSQTLFNSQNLENLCGINQKTIEQGFEKEYFVSPKSIYFDEEENTTAKSFFFVDIDKFKPIENTSENKKITDKNFDNFMKNHTAIYYKYGDYSKDSEISLSELIYDKITVGLKQTLKKEIDKTQDYVLNVILPTLINNRKMKI